MRAPARGFKLAAASADHGASFLVPASRTAIVSGYDGWLPTPGRAPDQS
ncbi:hypothetical protein FHS34_008252 [Streptomyces echinatus]|uniref:Uncharacterized protein n=1 Tax=Streptomyces echinatus TaxID=67293 RepID=A0A7W9UVQ9_9ACTN|nr:hypothetical protein [Streptomyces echinatus]